MGERHALLIGTDKFEDPGLSTLLAPVADVKALSEVLLDPGICDFSSAPVLLNPGIVELQRALRTLFNDRSADDLLLLYYTGHGLLDAQSGTLYLALHETMKAEPSIGSLDADYVKKRMKTSLAKTQIIMLDCCHSGAFMGSAALGAKGAAGSPNFGAVSGAFETGGSGHYILSACSKSELAYERSQEAPRSVFTQYLVEGLRTGDAAPDQEAITLDALYRYTCKQVADQKCPMDPQRTITDGSGEPVIARNPNIRKDVSKELRDALLKGDKLQQLGAVQQLQALVETDSASYTARRALEVLREGLNASDWVSVRNVIGAVPGVAQTIPPLAEAAPPQKLERLVANEPRRETDATAVKTANWLWSRLRKSTSIDKRLVASVVILAVCAAAAGVFLPHWYQQWIQERDIVVDGRTIPVGRPFQDQRTGGALGPDMVVVLAGKFMMGSPDIAGETDEHRQRKVTIAKRLAVGRYEITRGQFEEFVKETGFKVGASCQIWNGKGDWTETAGKSFRDPGIVQADDHPVVCVSWNDAQAYLKWLSKETNQNYRLLTEAEWEYAARAGTDTAYSTGNAIRTSDAKFFDPEKATAAVNATMRVGYYLPNNFGLSDMHGNVWEWVEDCFGSYEDAPEDGSAAKDSSGCKRVFRGGGWSNTLPNLRSANRLARLPEARYDHVGFRVARTL